MTDRRRKEETCPTPLAPARTSREAPHQLPSEARAQARRLDKARLPARPCRTKPDAAVVHQGASAKKQTGRHTQIRTYTRWTRASPCWVWLVTPASTAWQASAGCVQIASQLDVHDCARKRSPAMTSPESLTSSGVGSSQLTKESVSACDGQPSESSREHASMRLPQKSDQGKPKWPIAAQSELEERRSATITAALWCGASGSGRCRSASTTLPAARRFTPRSRGDSRGDSRLLGSRHDEL